MNLELAFISFGHMLGSVLTLAFGLFVFQKSPKKMHHLVFLLMCMSLGFFWLSYSFAIRTSPSSFVYLLWMVGVLLISHTFFFTHWVFSALGKTSREVPFIRFAYGAGIALIIACLLFPHLFIAEVVPKLYLKSYSSPGILYVLMVIYFLLTPLWPVFKLFLARYSAAPVEKNRLTYYLLAAFYGYVLGCIALFLVFDIPVNPIISVFTVTFLAPLGYGMINQNLMEVSIVIRKTLVASISIAALSGALAGISLGSVWLTEHIPGLTFWTVPIGAAIVAYAVGQFVWKQWQETEKLKYEFVTVAAHKLRTPLTIIRWGVASLQNEPLRPETLHTLEAVRGANDRLIELSTLLLSVAKPEGPPQKNIFSLRDMLHQAATDALRYADKKRVSIDTTIPSNPAMIIGNREEIRSAMEVLIENAITYSREETHVTVNLTIEGNKARYAVSDQGIGIAPEDLPRIFGQFFRTKEASLADTEGTGLGLFLTKRIIERHHGTIGVTSKGIGQGSEFWFTLPLNG